MLGAPELGRAQRDLTPGVRGLMTWFGLFGGGGMVTDLNLPDDLVAFLRGACAGTLDAGAYGTLRLVPLEQLNVETLELTPNYSPFARDDPHRYDGGYYAVPAVNLVEGNPDWPSYFPRLAFVWLPTEGRYGSFDQDHGELMLYRPGLGWGEIVDNVEAHVLAGESCGSEQVPMEYFRPWPKYPHVLPAEPGAAADGLA
jgi:hypothetical protein